MDTSARMLILSFLSCLDCQQVSTSKLEDEMTDLLNSTQKDLGFASIAWGPKAHKAEHEIFTDALVFVLQETNKKGSDEYTIVFRGTNPLSLSSWLFQDLNVAGLVPWSRQSEHTKSSTAYISKATDTSLGIHKNLTSFPNNTNLNSPSILPESKGKEQSILDWITSIYDPEKKFIFNITGHSLGGCISATYALWLYDELKHLNMLDNITLNVYPFAGPTAGNDQFAEYSKTCLPMSRYVNKLDIVPHAWIEEDMVDLSTIYESVKPDKIVDGLISTLAKQVNGLNYTQLEISKLISIDSKEIKNLPFNGFLLQAAFQHVVPYLIYALKKAPVKLWEVILDIIKSLIENDTTLFTGNEEGTRALDSKKSFQAPGSDSLEGKKIFIEEIERYLRDKI